MSGRDELLDKAIAEAKEAEDWQLVEWLRMARGGESAARWYSDKLREAHRTERRLLDENAELRKLVAKMAHEYGCGHLTLPQRLADRMRELGIEEGDA